MRIIFKKVLIQYSTIYINIHKILSEKYKKKSWFYFIYIIIQFYMYMCV